MSIDEKIIKVINKGSVVGRLISFDKDTGIARMELNEKGKALISKFSSPLSIGYTIINKAAKNE